jgi:hypothetical protein
VSESILLGALAWAAETLAFVRPIYCSAAFQERLQRDVSPFASRVLMLVALEACGALDSAAIQREAIQELATEEGVIHIGKPPNRQKMELRYALDLGAFSHSLPSYATLCRQTILAAPELNLIYLNDAEAYSITHILFYLGDFGNRRIEDVSGIPKRLVHRARYLVNCLLGIYIRARDWDLVGELLIASRCVRSVSSSWYRLGWECLRNAQLLSGAIPGPSYSPTEAQKPTDAAKPTYDFRHCYHSTLVAAVAARYARLPQCSCNGR